VSAQAVTSPPVVATPEPAARPGAGRRFLRDRRAVVGCSFLLVLALACFGGGRLAQDPNRQDLARQPEGPSWSHWFGTDELSRDVLARVLDGGRVSLQVGLGTALVATLVGSAAGIAAGYYRRRLDEAMMRLVDLMLILPLLPLAMVLSTAGTVGPFDGQQVGGLIAVLSLWMWAPVARVVRAAALEVGRAPFVEAARAVGASDVRILVRHMLPNVAGPIAVSGALAVAAAILLESALSFLGFGAQPPDATWGSMLSRSLATLEVYPWMTLFPGLAILLTVLSVNLMGDGLRDAFDPKSSHRR